jgi:hypothetical protein
MRKQTPKGRIFISYRREDSSGYAGRLFDHIKDHFGNDRVFMDISSIEPGVDFVDSIEKALNSCDTFLVLIGKDWLDCRDAGGNRRLDDPDDFIRIETSAALRRDVRVFPILVKGAVMPSSKDLPEEMVKLARRNAHELSDQRWQFDCNKLMAVLEKVVGPPDEGQRKADDEKNKPPGSKKNVKAIVALVLSLLLMFTLFAEGFSDSESIIGALVMAVIALIFGVAGWYDVKMKKSGGRGLAIGSIVSAVLLMLMLIGQYPTAPVPSSPAPSAAKPTQGSWGKAVSSRLDTMQERETAGRRAPQADSIAGRWQGSDGMTYLFAQYGNTVQVSGLNQFGVQMMTGQGLLDGSRPLSFNYSLADGTSGIFSLEMVAEGKTMNAAFTNHSTGLFGRILLNRQSSGY